MANALQDDRSFLAFSVLGLAPDWFEVEATSYVSDAGDISARVEAEYNMLFTQKLIQPRFAISLAVQDVPEYQIGAGFNDIESGLRLRYEFSRWFTPCMGVEWIQAM